MAKPPSLQDVARTAGLSPATVSRYLNGSLSLPPETAGRIDHAIETLNYQPNPHARSLSRGRSDTIGLLVPEIDNPFFARLAAAVEREASAAGLSLMLYSSLNRKERELHYLERLRRNFVDGLIFATNHVDDGELTAAIGRSSNVVLVDEDIDGVDAPKVFSDNVAGGRLAARNMTSAGHRNLAFIGGPEGIMSSRERLAGFREEAAMAGAEVTVALFGAYSIHHGRDALRQLLDWHPDVTGVFVASDELLFGALETLRDRKIPMGGGLSLVTFDDAGPLAFLDPPVTAIRQDVAGLAREAVSALRGRIAGIEDPPVARVPVELVERRSVSPLV
ncbi:LacI family DNA-binding transcriptional regulator [Rhizobium sp. FKL33]|uniref:LacI family DNA-binding transcriptional regulator n=1 Tax=Rhizobium sp. FKL33 TaxID=2562307 RepID=UPI0010C0985B|nr:LacI family DNA-binding transcriptional regulator [Rhizobium sp. FKL33]